MNSLMTYINDSLAELRHVRWPTRQQAIRLATIVLGFTAASAIVFGAVDFLLAQLIRTVVFFAV